MRTQLVTILAAAMLAAHGEVGAEAVAEDAKPLKVLAIGNSFSIGMHAALPPVAKSFGRRVDICTMYIEVSFGRPDAPPPRTLAVAVTSGNMRNLFVGKRGIFFPAGSISSSKSTSPSCFGERILNSRPASA